MAEDHIKRLNAEHPEREHFTKNNLGQAHLPEGYVNICIRFFAGFGTYLGDIRVTRRPQNYDSGPLVYDVDYEKDEPFDLKWIPNAPVTEENFETYFNNIIQYITNVTNA